MGNKREVKDINEAKKLLEKVVKREKLTNYPVVDNKLKNKKKT